MYSNFNRGETFRRTMLRLGEIRSIFPEGVPIMAVTATATRTLQHEIARILGMCGPTVISVSPCKINNNLCSDSTIPLQCNNFSTHIDAAKEGESENA